MGKLPRFLTNTATVLTNKRTGYYKKLTKKLTKSKRNFPLSNDSIGKDKGGGKYTSVAIKIIFFLLLILSVYVPIHIWNQFVFYLISQETILVSKYPVSWFCSDTALLLLQTVGSFIGFIALTINVSSSFHAVLTTRCYPKNRSKHFDCCGLTTVIFTGFTLMAICAFAYLNSIQPGNHFTRHLYSSLNGSSETSQDLRTFQLDAWNTVYGRGQCCGVLSYKDARNHKELGNNFLTVPENCCVARVFETESCKQRGDCWSFPSTVVNFSQCQRDARGTIRESDSLNVQGCIGYLQRHVTNLILTSGLAFCVFLYSFLVPPISVWLYKKTGLKKCQAILQA